MSGQNFLSIEDLRLGAGRALPKTIFQSLQAGSWSEATLRRNTADMAAVMLKQRVLVDVSQPRLDTQVLGQAFSLPFGLGPTGMHGLFHRSAEFSPAHAAKEAGIPFCMSTMATRSLEEVIARTGSPIWLQLFMLRDRGFVKAFVERAVAAGCGALFVTVDLPARGKRLVDFRNGMTVPPQFTTKNFLEFAMKPAWALGALQMRKQVLGNLQGHVPGLDDADEVLKWTDTQYDDTVTWKDIDWVRKLWPGPLVLKGILDPDDARTAAAAGAQGIVVSNHGGRQLDVTRSTIAALPSIAQAVGGALEILLDGGVRSGQDVLKALALGASFCLLGRAYLYGLAADGRAGVASAIQIIRDELAATMALTGVTSIAEVGAHLIEP
jgi:L-lactate dehydrogenase (cytochrome)